jgi:hypothetical protein
MSDPIVPIPSRPAQPKIIYTQAYLDDPIRFVVDARFDPESVLHHIDGIAVVDRDSTNFFIAEINTSHQVYYPVTFVVPVHQRSSVGRVIDKTIRQLLPTI